MSDSRSGDGMFDVELDEESETGIPQFHKFSLKRKGLGRGSSVTSDKAVQTDKYSPPSVREYV